MNYNSELFFLIDVLKKSRIGAAKISLESEEIDKMTEVVLPFIGARYKTVGDMLGRVFDGVIYKRHEKNGIYLLYMLLPDEDQKNVLIVGPYTTEKHTRELMLEEAERLALPTVLHRAFADFMTSLPYVADEGSVLALVSVFADRVYEGGYSLEDVNASDSIAVDFNEISTETESDERAVLTSMRLMEERYRFENELIRLVSEGQSAKAEMILSAFSEESFEPRVKDALRNIKNYTIIVNTLLRKAVERGGVHPVNIDKISSRYAVEIERCTCASDLFALIKEMVRAYCRLVSKYALGDVSPIVQKAVFLIDNDPSRDISLSSLAQMTSVSPGYLSSIFKREMNKTVTDYITDKRISHATHLLTTTHLQIQTVASNCGILDVQYFSKIFKKKTGLTPREYREKYKKAN